MFGFSKEAVRVKVKKCEGKLQPELRKFSVDPQITSLEVLQSILVKAFDIKSDFTLLYRTTDDCGQEIYMPLLSDWELDAAFLKVHNTAVTQRSEPCLHLRVDMKPFSEASEDWEPPYTTPASPALPQHKDQSNIALLQQSEKQQESQTGFQGLIMNQVERTFNMVSRALNLYDDPDAPQRPPLSDIEFRSFLDTVGQITNTSKLREVIYCGGIDPSLRKVVWKHILNIYPDGMTGKERMDYIKRKATEYYMLRARWKDCVQKGMVNPDLSYVTSMVKKDVLRTDRHHNFYAGSDDNQNIASLFNILTTYALNHPTVSYCQGMSDLASPLLVTMGDEAHAYICLCALMSRLKPNFLLDGVAMTLKFSHLTESLQLYDAEFYNYLKMQQADDLLFCYRWLLLEMKREFAFDDALTMLEVLWASLPQRSVTKELVLIEREFDPTTEYQDGDPPPVSPLIKTPRENAYAKVCAMRRQSSSFSLANVKAPKLSTSNQINHSLDECSTDNKPLQQSKEFQSLDDAGIKINMEKVNESVEETKNSESGKTNRVHENGRRVNMKEAVTWSSATNLTNGNAQESKDTPLGNQIRMLRDKISLHNNKFFTSLDSSLDVEDPARKPKVKMVKNLNEFLSLAAMNKPAAPRKEKLERAKSVIVETSLKDCPEITFTKSSYDESDLTAHKLYKDLKALNKSNNSDGSSPDDSQEYYPMTTSVTRELRLELEHLDRQVFGPTCLATQTHDSTSDSTSTDEKPHPTRLDDVRQTLEVSTQIIKKSSAKSIEDIYLWENPLHRNTPTTKTASSCPQTPDEQAELDFDADNAEIIVADTNNSIQESISNEVHQHKNGRQDSVSKSHNFFSSMSQELENAKRSCESLLISKQNTNFQSVATTINNFQRKYEALRPQMAQPRSSISSEGVLPPPTEFGAGNPFLMFLCLSVLMQHRDYIMRNRMDYNELAMHFDKMVRKHNVHRVLNQARQMYALYLKQYACDNLTA